MQKVYFREGAPVRKGQLLFTIDKRPFQAALQSAKALTVKAISDLAQAQQRTDVLQAQAELADAQAVLTRADQDVARLVPLAKEKAVTEQDLDAAIANQKSARASVDAKRANSPISKRQLNTRLSEPERRSRRQTRASRKPSSS